MKLIKSSTIIIYLTVVFTVNSYATLYQGIEFPDGERSFADEVVLFDKGSYSQPPYIDPTNALGIPDGWPSCCSLGNYGSLVLRFNDNFLTTSGDSSSDIYIFEVGGGSENVDVSISTDNVNWIYIGRVKAGTQGIDIDSKTGVIQNQLYSYVKLVDVGNEYFTGDYAGADIDAVGAIFSVPEPTTLCMLSLGTLGLLRKRRVS